MLNRGGTPLRGYAPGGWDMFHIGHLNLLRRCRGLCDYLVVGVATDHVLEGMKGRAPTIPFRERLEVISALRVVDEAIPDTSADKRVAWRRARFDVLFKGDDWRGTMQGEALEAALAEVGARVCYLPYTPGTSSTMLRRALESVLS